MCVSVEPISFHIPERFVAPMVISLPHAGSFLPSEFVKKSALSELELHLSEDVYTDQLYWDNNLDIAMVKANYSRAYIDVNREPLELTKRMFKDELPSFINHFSQKAAKGFGTIPEKIKHGMKIYKHKIIYDEAKDRIETVYRPFHQNLAMIIKKISDEFGSSLIIDGHSMPYRKNRKNYDVVLSDNFGSSSLKKYSELFFELLKKQGFSVKVNTPYSGGYIICHYGCPELGVSALQIELLRSLYANETSLKKNKDFGEIKAKIGKVLKESTDIISKDYT